MANEVEQFIELWEHESGLTRALLETVSKDKYDFRPYPEGRSMGELAWHLAELEAIFSSMARDRSFKKPEGLVRPRTVPEIVSGYERIHRESVERVRVLRPAELDLEFPFIGGGGVSEGNGRRGPVRPPLSPNRGTRQVALRVGAGARARG